MVYLTIMTRIWDFSQIAAVTPTVATVVVAYPASPADSTSASTLAYTYD